MSTSAILLAGLVIAAAALLAAGVLLLVRWVARLPLRRDPIVLVARVEPGLAEPMLRLVLTNRSDRRVGFRDIRIDFAPLDGGRSHRTLHSAEAGNATFPALGPGESHDILVRAATVGLDVDPIVAAGRATLTLATDVEPALIRLPVDPVYVGDEPIE